MSSNKKYLKLIQGYSDDYSSSRNVANQNKEGVTTSKNEKANTMNSSVDKEIDDNDFCMLPENNPNFIYSEKANMVAAFSTNSKSNTLIISSLSIGNDKESSMMDKEKRSQNLSYGSQLNMFLDHILEGSACSDRNEKKEKLQNQDPNCSFKTEISSKSSKSPIPKAADKNLHCAIQNEFEWLNSKDQSQSEQVKKRKKKILEAIRIENEPDKQNQIDPSTSYLEDDKKEKSSPKQSKLISAEKVDFAKIMANEEKEMALRQLEAKKFDRTIQTEIKYVEKLLDQSRNGENYMTKFLENALCSIQNNLNANKQKRVSHIVIKLEFGHRAPQFMYFSL